MNWFVGRICLALQHTGYSNIHDVRDITNVAIFSKHRIVIPHLSVNCETYLMRTYSINFNNEDGVYRLEVPQIVNKAYLMGL